MSIKIKYHLGEFEINHPTQLALTKNTVTASQVQQVLDSQEFLEMVNPIFGDYKYTLHGDSYDGYEIHTNCGFVETRIHKTPRAAYKAFLNKRLSWAEMMHPDFN